MIAEQTPLFAKQKKKLHQNQIQCLDQAVQEVLENPMMGDQKKGDLDFVRIFKFRMLSQECLLAYQWIKPNRIILLALGSHENFYRNLKRKVNA